MFLLILSDGSLALGSFPHTRAVLHSALALWGDPLLISGILSVSSCLLGLSDPSPIPSSQEAGWALLVSV